MTVSEKKVGQVKFDAARLPVNLILRIGEMWKELNQTKRM
jgi:hypothetical protein